MAMTLEKSEIEGPLMEYVPYSNAVGSMMYAMISSRLDIAYGASVQIYEQA